MTDKQIKEVFKNGFYCIEPCLEIKELLAELKAKEQECERLKEEVSLLKEINLKLQPIEDVRSLEKCYLQQLDQLKEQLEAYKMEAEEGYEINAELKAELEAERKWHKSADKISKTNSEYTVKLKQTLAEIKEIAEDTKDKFYGAIHTGSLYNRLEQIIRKINEVEDEN